jgi:hypothetical protein
MPIPFLFYIFGERLRRHSRYAPTEMGKRKDEEIGNEGNGCEGSAESKEE